MELILRSHSTELVLVFASDMIAQDLALLSLVLEETEVNESVNLKKYFSSKK